MLNTVPEPTGYLPVSRRSLAGLHPAFCLSMRAALIFCQYTRCAAPGKVPGPSCSTSQSERGRSREPLAQPMVGSIRSPNHRLNRAHPRPRPCRMRQGQGGWLVTWNWPPLRRGFRPPGRTQRTGPPSYSSYGRHPAGCAQASGCSGVRGFHRCCDAGAGSHGP